ncbi:MAG TPA: beta-N-acetylhexosaminidase [Terracidiphilus sp.]|jgi:beta-N-acetylhexosaminidase|nr:beta-N-acetylhexosaminidase [Terracidiphilus sp.]
MNLRHAAGELLVVGLAGTDLSGLERAWLKLVRPGGVILFKRNIADVAQTRTLLHQAGSVCAPCAVRCVDVEGGTVNRLRDALAPLPSAQAVGAAMRRLRRPALPRQFGSLIARAVKAFGFNTTLAPVVDLALAEAAEVLGSRPPGAGPAEVIAFACAFLAGLAAEGVVGCGKHFPGLGGATGDTHFVTPEIGRNWQQIWNQDLAPYRELHRAMPMVMTNHAAYPATAGKNRPASASAFWITRVLRERIGYRGIVLSDDLEMGGILKFMPVEEAAVAAIRAGSDLIEICHSAELIVRSYEALLAQAERSPAFRRLLVERAQSTARKRARLYGKSAARALTATQFESLRAQILRFRDLIAASEADAIAPRATSPAEAS